MTQEKPKKESSMGLSAGQDELPVSVGGWSTTSARSVLRLRFGDRECERIIRLESKAAQTRLTPGEQAELAGFEQVTVFLEFLKRNAQQFLTPPGDPPSQGNLPPRGASKRED